MINDKCPICGGKVTIKCRCMRSDSKCENGHEWFYCLAHDAPRLVIGKSNHSESLEKCFCDKNKLLDVTR